MERILLQTLAFDLKVDHPYKYVLSYCKHVGGDDHKNIMQFAWNFANDSFRTTLCLQYEPSFIAAAAVYLSSNFKKIPLPEKWWERFETTVAQTECK